MQKNLLPNKYIPFTTMREKNLVNNRKLLSFPRDTIKSSRDGEWGRGREEGKGRATNQNHMEKKSVTGSKIVITKIFYSNKT